MPVGNETTACGTKPYNSSIFMSFQAACTVKIPLTRLLFLRIEEKEDINEELNKKGKVKLINNSIDKDKQQ
ncbi:hypothetical protein ABW02_23230 [Niallia circulans]|uniref:Uncharacterized protein n=1 Tax=Niallia circulans TaxID=1397 RepID=A0A0J1I6K2_NIACI|nr:MULTISPECIES: hypothetical protein [Niallia]EOR22113.1 hypothetical protein A499_19473 [Niallia nealsonii AAU1]SLL37512.1 Uncharacterised protein [Mycobacteroides abscessus subsp. abscessus]HEO8422698.1 hypothetical protein [Yersinia enterocolitica]KLV21589.1 hypothetical protein ABW02_23230 [Niallia circulans]MCB5237256.1 hypothetical protein [Niallia circulans]